MPTSTKLLETKAYINGKWIDGEGKTVELISPATNELIGKVNYCSKDQADQAIQSAKESQKEWKNVSLMERIEILERARQLLIERSEEIARTMTLEMGKTIKEAREDIIFAKDNFSHAMGSAMRFEGVTLPNVQEKTNNKRIHVTHSPIGVVALITPWNFPIAIPNETLPYALAVGNTVVWKPSELTPFSAYLLTKVYEDAGVPPGVINLVHGSGDIGGQLVEDENTNAVSFTGSTAVGEIIAKSAGLKKVFLELGGNGPIIVMDDGNIDEAVEASIIGCFYIAGQVCTAAERILVHEDVHEEFVSKLLERTKQLITGDPLLETTDMGPLSSQAIVNRTNQHIEDAVAKGSTIIYGGKHDGLYFEPTILLNVTPDMEIAQEETFGPVAPIMRFSTREEAVEVANGTKYGLTAGVFTSGLENAWYFADRLEHGTVNVNETTNYWDLLAPFGGMKKSGNGRLLAKWSLEELTQVKQVTFDISKCKKL